MNLNDYSKENIKIFFASFCIQENLKLKDDVNETLKEYCLDLKNKNSGRKLSNWGGWQSDFLDFRTKQLLPIINEICSRELIFRNILSIKKQFNFQINAGWININEKSNFNMIHFHPMSVLSCVYYVKVPESSGNLVLESPIQQHGHILYSEFIEKYNDINGSIMTIIPREKDLVIFPSWLKHWVEPNESDDQRISIAFNIGVR